MYKKSDIEMERLRVVKVARSLVRLKHSLDADKELNDRLPDLVKDFDTAIQQGYLKALSSDIAKEILES